MNSPSVKNDGTYLTSSFQYRRNKIEHSQDGSLSITPQIHDYVFKTLLKPKKTGLMLVGFGGNNGSTFYGATIANKMKMTWRTK